MLSADYNAALKQETTTAAHGHEAVRDPIKPARAKEAASSPAAPARPQSPGPSAGAGQGRPRALSLSVEIPSSDKQVRAKCARSEVAEGATLASSMAPSSHLSDVRSFSNKSMVLVGPGLRRPL